MNLHTVNSANLNMSVLHSHDPRSHHPHYSWWIFCVKYFVKMNGGHWNYLIWWNTKWMKYVAVERALMRCNRGLLKPLNVNIYMTI